MPALHKIAVIGASLGGLRTAEALRLGGYDDRLIIIGDEPHAPYNRPPLSKDFLTHPLRVEELTLPAADGLDLDWHLGTRATSLDLVGRSVTSTDGELTDLDAVVIATGSTARRLDLSALEGIDHGVLTDHRCAALGGHSRVLAVGDVATTPPSRSARPVRGEHWSRVGTPDRADHHTVEHTDTGWAVTFTDRDRLVAVAALDMPGRIATGRRTLLRAMPTAELGAS